MNMLATTNQAVSEMMSSREIAEMYGKNHYDVLKKVRTLEPAYLEAFGVDGKFAVNEYKDSIGRSLPEILLNKSQALFVASRFDAVLHAKVQKRWEDLEAQGQQALPDYIDGNFMIRVGEQMQAQEQKIALLENKVEAMEQIIEEQKPKVLFAETVAVSDQSCTVEVLSKILNQNGYKIGRNRLFALLRKHGFVVKQEGESRNLPTQKSLDLGVLELSTSLSSIPCGVSRVNRCTKVTSKGQIYFINKFMAKQAPQDGLFAQLN